MLKGEAKATHPRATKDVLLQLHQDETKLKGEAKATHPREQPKDVLLQLHQDEAKLKGEAKAARPGKRQRMGCFSCT